MEPYPFGLQLAQYSNSSFSVGGAAVATEAYAVCARRTERRDVHVAEALGGAAEGSYEQEAAVVEEDEEMEQEDERGVAKRRPQRARCTGMGRTGIEVEWRKLLQRIAL
jgi:hypothetical protein